MQTLMNAVMFFVVFGSVLFLAYVTTKFIGTRTNRIIKGKYIKIIETVNLGFDSKLHLVKAGDEFVLISASGKNVQILSKVKLDDYSSQEVENGDNNFNFKDIFDKYKQGFNWKQGGIPFFNAKGSENEGTDNSQVFNANLNRLKEITACIASQKTEDGDENTNEN